MESDLRPTITKVAAIAGVSISTVSRALRDSPLISAETRAKVKEIAESIGYTTNPYISTLMSHLRSSKPVPFRATIALLDTFAQPEDWKKFTVQRQFQEGSVAQAAQLGYIVERVWAFSPGFTNKGLTRILLNRGIRGILIPPFRDFSSKGREIPLELEQFACVTVGCKMLEPGLHFATNDQYSTGMLAHTSLLDLGYKRVGLVIPNYVECIVDRRFSSGFRNASESRGRTTSRSSIFRYNQEDTASRMFLEWFHAFKPDAICTVLPEVGAWLKEANIKVPQDVAFATLDWDEEFGDWSGVNQGSHRVGAAAIDVMVQMLQRNEIGPPAHPRGLSVEGSWVNGRTAPPKMR